MPSRATPWAYPFHSVLTNSRFTWPRRTPSHCDARLPERQIVLIRRLIASIAGPAKTLEVSADVVDLRCAVLGAAGAGAELREHFRDDQKRSDVLHLFLRSGKAATAATSIRSRLYRLQLSLPRCSISTRGRCRSPGPAIRRSAPPCRLTTFPPDTGADPSVRRMPFARMRGRPAPSRGPHSTNVCW